jgi:uroporphyrinogen-III synthase
VLVTRERERASGLAAALRAHGAAAVELPCVEIAPFDDPRELEALDRALASWASFGWAIFTSVHAVDAVAGRLAAGGRAISGPRVAAVGAVTAARLAALGFGVELRPPRADAAALAQALAALGVAGERVFVPASELADGALSAALTAAGASVTEVRAYRNRRPRYDAGEVARLLEPAPDVVLFASPSAADHLVEILREAGREGLAAALRAVTIGPRTTETVRRLGIEVAAEAWEASAAGLVAATVEYWQRNGGG